MPGRGLTSLHIAVLTVTCVGTVVVGLHAQGPTFRAEARTVALYATVQFARIAEELRHQYLIGFVPAVFDGQMHRVEVRSVRPDLAIRARRTFIAGGPS